MLEVVKKRKLNEQQRVDAFSFPLGELSQTVKML
jgi:hypothetical protein